MYRNGEQRRHRLQQLIHRFREKGATSPEKAMTVQELGLPPRFEQAMQQRLGQTGIFVETNGKYYLNEERLKPIQEQRVQTSRAASAGGGGGYNRQGPPGWMRYGGLLLMLPIGIIVVAILFFAFYYGGFAYYPGELIIILLVVLLVVFVLRILFWQSRRRYRQQHWQISPE